MYLFEKSSERKAENTLLALSLLKSLVGQGECPKGISYDFKHLWYYTNDRDPKELIPTQMDQGLLFFREGTSIILAYMTRYEINEICAGIPLEITKSTTGEEVFQAVSRGLKTQEDNRQKIEDITKLLTTVLSNFKSHREMKDYLSAVYGFDCINNPFPESLRNSATIGLSSTFNDKVPYFFINKNLSHYTRLLDILQGKERFHHLPAPDPEEYKKAVKVLTDMGLSKPRMFYPKIDITL